MRLPHSPKTDSDRLIKDNHGRYCPVCSLPSPFQRSTDCNGQLSLIRQSLSVFGLWGSLIHRTTHAVMPLTILHDQLPSGQSCKDTANWRQNASYLENIIQLFGFNQSCCNLELPNKRTEAIHGNIWLSLETNPEPAETQSVGTLDCVSGLTMWQSFYLDMSQSTRHLTGTQNTEVNTSSILGFVSQNVLYTVYSWCHGVHTACLIWITALHSPGRQWLTEQSNHNSSVKVRCAHDLQ